MVVLLCKVHIVILRLKKKGRLTPIHQQHPATKDYEVELENIRFCFSGAAPLSSELAAQLEKVVPNASLGQGYGMSNSLDLYIQRSA